METRWIEAPLRERDELVRCEAGPARKRRATEKSRTVEIDKTQQGSDRAEAAYEQAMHKWRS